MKRNKGSASKSENLSNKPVAQPPVSYDKFAGHTMHPDIRTDFITIPASLTVSEALAIIQTRNKRAVIIQRVSDNTRMYYFFPCSQIQDLLMNKKPQEILEIALALPESNSTSVLTPAMAKKQLQESIVAFQPAVIIDDGSIAGYIEPELFPAMGKIIVEKSCETINDTFDVGVPPDEIDYSKITKQRDMPLAFPDNDIAASHDLGNIKIDKSALKAALNEVISKKTSSRRGTPSKSFDKASGSKASVIAIPKPKATAAEAPATDAHVGGLMVPEDIATPAPVVTEPLCYFAAQMPEEVVTGETQQVQTTISRNEIELAVSKASGKGSAPLPASPDQKITVRLIPKRNFEVIGDSRADVKAPLPGEPSITLFFDVKAGACGEGEIWIAFCQGPVSLITLKLKPQIVTTKSASDTESIQVQTSVTPPSGIPERTNTMWVYLRENDGKIRYRYCLWLDAMDIDQEYESPEFNGDIMTVLQPYMNLFDEVETETETDFNQLNIQLRSIGAKLFQTLFPKELQSVFWEHRNEITHLKFYCEEPYIPWEILHVCEPGKHLPVETKFLGQMGLVRWLHGHTSPTQLRIRPDRAWYVTPSYPGNELESAQEEGKLLQNLFKAKPLQPATRPEVTKLLSAEGPFDLFHFAGHGDASETQITDCRIVLEAAGADANRMLQDLTPDIVSGLCQLKAEDGTRPIVVINSCRAGKMGYHITGLSGFAPAFLEREAGVFIGALWKIGDKPALTFIKAFYEALKKGKIVAEAVKKGREEAYKAGDATYLAYVVYADPFAHLVK